MKLIHKTKKGAHSGPHKINRTPYGSTPVWQRRMMGVIGADWKEYDAKHQDMFATQQTENQTVNA